MACMRDVTEGLTSRTRFKPFPFPQHASTAATPIMSRTCVCGCLRKFFPDRRRYAQTPSGQKALGSKYRLDSCSTYGTEPETAQNGIMTSQHLQCICRTSYF